MNGQQRREAARMAVVAAGRRVLRRLEATPLVGLTRVPPIQRLRDRAKPAVTSSDVLDLLGALTTAGVRYWLAGGWGIDALAGRQTRAHRDLDLLVDGPDTATALDVLRCRGFAPVRPAPDGGDRYVPGGLLPHRHLLQRADLLTVDVHPVDSSGWETLRGIGAAFATGVIDGMPVECLSVPAQRAFHRGFSLSAKQRADLRLLEQLEC